MGYQEVRVAFLGFSAFERDALAAYVRLGGHQPGRWAIVGSIDDADHVVADADQPHAVTDVLTRRRLGDTVFIGSEPPDGARAWLLRPIDPVQVMRELDALAGGRAFGHPAPAPVLPSRMPWARRTAPPPDHAPQRRASDSEPGGFDLLPTSSTLVRPPRHHDVLVVDDSDIAVLFLDKLLHHLGLDCRRAATSSEALAILERESFGFVILDVELGEDSELDGLALCRELKQRHRRVGRAPPVVLMLSAHDGPADRLRGDLVGCDAYLGKPLAEDVLRHTLLRHGAALTAPRPFRARPRWQVR